MLPPGLHATHTFWSTVLPSGAAGAVVAWIAATVLRARARRSEAAKHSAVTRVEAHLAASSPEDLPMATSAALRRDVQAVVESREAASDLEVLDRVLRDIRDLVGADEAILWRCVSQRQSLVPSGWSTEGVDRPSFFDVEAWGASVSWTAAEGEMQFAGDVSGHSTFAAVPVGGGDSAYGVLTLTGAKGLHFASDDARSWLPRFSAQVSTLLKLFEVRSEYGRHMRQGDALLHAVRRLHDKLSAETLAQTLCDTARDVTSAPIAGVVRWSATDQHGVLQSISAGADLETGFHVTADSLVGRVCVERLPLVLENARAATAEHCPFGGIARPIGSVAIVPVISEDQVIGALIVEGRHPGDIGQHEARNVGLLGAVARGPLEIVWEIEEVTRRAQTDSLTGLFNRRHFEEHLRKAVAQSDRFGGTCSLIFADLDHFKEVNDHLGHDAGDTVLKHVARVLADAVRTVDLCARYGGEEIAVLLPQTSQAGAAELAERLRAVLEARPAMHGGQAIPVTASFGVASYPVPVPYGDWLVAAADKALYEAKAAGRNCVKVIQPSHVTPALYKPH
jgi:diguanylate cyclase (GGDEF)-like protein